MSASTRAPKLLQPLLGLIDNLFAGAVLMREAARQSRQWQMYAARTGFSTALMAVLLTGIYISVAAPSSLLDKADMGWLGRGMFISFTVAQVFLAMVLAPLMAASAVIEEVEDNTLDVLVLTRLHPGQILGAKILSRVLALLTIVLGALPVMALVVTVGGVSTVEVVSVTVGTLVSVAVLGTMGGFFALFTRSPMLAMMATAAYTLPMYWLLPMAYGLTAGDVTAGVHFSPLMAPFNSSWSALIAPLSYLPVLALLLALGRRLFELRVSRAHIRRALSHAVWGTRAWGLSVLVLVLSGVVILPFFGALNWALANAKSGPLFGSLTPLAQLGSGGVVWLWWVGALTAATWAYLRVGMDLIDVLDTLLGSRHKKKTSKPTRVWTNPVTWWEARPRAWGVAGVPLLVTWGLVLLGVLQTGIWVFPGGLLAMGYLNTLAAMIFTIWLGSWSITRERNANTLGLLCTTTMPSWRILAGKLWGVALPTLPLLLLSLPMFALGVPHLAWGWAIFNKGLGGASWWDPLLRGVLSWIWFVPLWGFLMVSAMAIALRLPPKRPAFAITLILALTGLGAPAALAHLFPDQALFTWPARFLAPPLAGHAPLWLFGVSTVLISLSTLLLLGLTSVKLRRWAVVAVLLCAGLLASPARAQDPNALQDKFILRAHPVGDGLVRQDEWATVQVGLVNTGAADRGTLELSERQGQNTTVLYQRTIDLPEGARKRLTLRYKPGRRGGERVLRLHTQRGRQAKASFTVQNIAPQDIIIGVLGVDPVGLTVLRDSWSGPVPGPSPRPKAKNPRQVRIGMVDLVDAPGLSAGWAAFDQLVWPAADPSQLREGQLRALRHWVADGGHLLLTVSDGWRQLADSSLAEALPVELSGVRDVQLAPLVSALGGRVGQLPAPAPLATARRRELPGRSIWVRADLEGQPAWVTGSYGLGTVSVLLADLNTEPLASQPREQLWRQLLVLPKPSQRLDLSARMRWFPPKGLESMAWAPQGAEVIDQLLHALHATPPDITNCVYGGHTNFSYSSFDGDISAAADKLLRERLADIPGLAPLPMSWLIAFSGLYLLVIGPVDYLVLRALKRQPWTWISFPVTIGIFSAVALAGTAAIKGDQAVVSRVELIDLLPGTDLWRGSTTFGVFSTRKVDLSLGSGVADSVIAPLENAGFMSDPVLRSSDGAGELSYHAETWTLAYSRSEWIGAAPGSLSARRSDQGWEISNSLPFDLDEVWLVQGWSRNFYPGEGRMRLGPLASGDSALLPSTTPPEPLPSSSDGDDLAWSVLFERDGGRHGHLDGNNARFTLVGLAHAPVEPLQLSGLRPTHKALVMVRAPLTPALLPNPDVPPASLASRLGNTQIDGQVRFVKLEADGPPAIDLAATQAMLREFPGVTYCYRKDLNRGAHFSGSLRVVLRIGPDGTVNTVDVLDAPKESDQRCIQNALTRRALPIPPAGYANPTLTLDLLPN